MTAPILNTGTTLFSSIDEDSVDVTNPGNTIAELIADGQITDVDINPAPKAIAIVAVDNSHGTWQYKLGSGSWITFNFSGENEGKGLLLEDQNRVRFVPNNDWFGTVSEGITFHALDSIWLEYVGEYRVIEGNIGGSGPLSEAIGTASITVNPINDKPVLDVDKTPTLGEIPFGILAPQPNNLDYAVRVADLINRSGDGLIGNFTDVDGDAPGLAITGVNGGSLYFTIDSGVTWQELSGNVSNSKALMLHADADTYVYFRTYATSPTILNDALSFKAWDRTGGFENGETGVDLSSIHFAASDVIHTGGNPMRVAVKDDFAFIATFSQGVKQVNLNTLEVTLLANVQQARGIAVEGDRLYFSGDYRLYIYDISTPSTPTLLGSSINNSAYSNSIALSGNYAFVSDLWNGLKIFDVSTPSNPVQLSFTGDGGSSAVGILGNYAYVGYGANSVKIFDVSNPSAPYFITSYSANSASANSVSQITLSGIYAFISFGLGGVDIVDISNPLAPVHKATIPASGGQSTSVLVEGQYAYVTGSHSIRIIDIANPSNPQVIDTLPINGSNLQGATVSNNQVFITDDGSMLRVINLPLSPDFVSTQNDTISVNVVNVPPEISGTFATDKAINDNEITTPFAGSTISINDANGDNVSLKITYSASNGSLRGEGLTGSPGDYILEAISTPELIARLQALVFAPTANQVPVGTAVETIFTITPVDEYDQGTSIQSKNVTVLSINDAPELDPNPILTVSTFDRVGPPVNGRIEGSFLVSEIIQKGGGTNNFFDADGHSPGLALISVDQALGSLFFSIDGGNLWQLVGDVSAYNARVFYADADTRLYFQPHDNFHGQLSDIIRFKAWDRTGSYNNGEIGVNTDLVTITERGALNTSGTAWGIDLQDGYAFVADKTGGLKIINIINPDSPVLIASENSFSDAMSVVIKGDYAYVADGGGGLRIVDVSNINLPQLKASIGGLGYAFKVILQEDYAYIAGGNNGFSIVNISNPIEPSLVKTTVIPDQGYAYDIDVLGDYAFVAGSTHLYIYDISNPSQPLEIGRYSDDFFPHKVRVHENLAFIANNNGQLRIIDVSDRTQPQLITDHSFGNIITDMAVQGNYLFISGGQYANYGVQVLEISDASQPKLVGFIQTSDFNIMPYSLALDGAQIAVANFAGGVLILDNDIFSKPFSSQSDTITIQVEASPIIEDLDNDSATGFVGNILKLDAGIATTVTDLDSDYFDTGILSITTVNGSVNGHFRLDGITAKAGDDLSSASAIMFAGAKIFIEAVEIGLVHGEDTGQAGASLVINFNANATPERVSSLLQNLAYTTNTAGSQEFDIVITDGKGGVSAPARVSLTFNTLPFVPSPMQPSESDVPESTSVFIDGTIVTTTSITSSDGLTTTVTVVPIISENREDESGDSNLADIPLVFDSNDQLVLKVGLPIGVGVTSQEISSVSSVTLRDLLLGASYQKIDQSLVFEQILLAGIDSFVANVEDERQVTVRTITFESNGIIPNQSIVITGSDTISGNDSTNGLSQEALILDARNLPLGAVLQLDQVEFAVILGEVRVVGGKGNNIVIGDDAAQYIMLGEGDDILRGGGGDDTIGSGGGNDRLFGDDGNDILFVGSGHNLLHGGRDFDTVIYDGDVDRFVITRDHGRTIITSLDDPYKVDTIINVEMIRFNNLDYHVENSNELSLIATLYKQVLDRQAEIDGFQYWAETAAIGNTMGSIAMAFMRSSEKVSIAGHFFDDLSTVKQIEGLYTVLLGRDYDELGKAYWLEKLNSGIDIDVVASAFVYSIEFTGMQLNPTDWDFFV